LVENHDTFQGYYFFHFIGRDRDARDRFAGHPCYERTAEFCASYDAPAFDPNYETCRSNSSSRRCERSSPALAAY